MLKLEFAVPERYAGILETGTPVRFFVDGDLEEYSAKIYAIDSDADANTRSFTVRATYDNSKGKLHPGRYANITLTAQTFKNAISVPSQAIVSEMGVDKVFLYRNGKAEPAEITKGLRNESHVQVVRGLSVGDTVIVSGTMQLRTGQKVILDDVK